MIICSFGVSTKHRLPGPHFIRRGPQEYKKADKSSREINFFIKILFNEIRLHLFQLFQIISFIRKSWDFMLTTKFVIFFEPIVE